MSDSLDHGLPLSLLMTRLAALRADLVAAETSYGSLADIHPERRASARNLLHYLALRRHDLRALQLELAACGLSSLGRAEAHVLGAVDAVLDVLHRLARRPWLPTDGVSPIDFATGRRLLADHTRALLGPPPTDRAVAIMVTMPGSAADDYELVANLLRAGMNCMRINCAHDDTHAWGRMVEHLRRAERALGLPCRILMDVAGPKLRTGALADTLAVLKVRPRRDRRGRLVAPARLWLTAAEESSPAPLPATSVLPLPAAFVAALAQGDIVSLRDARDRRRRLRVVEVAPAGAWAELDRTAYLVPGLRVAARGPGGRRRRATIGELPGHDAAIELSVGDRLLVTRDARPGENAVHGDDGRVLHPAHVGCSLPQVLDDVTAGDRIWFDDGHIGGVIEAIDDTGACVAITDARPGGALLRADKGINLPDSTLSIAALTADDHAALPFIAAHADMVALSFANTASDVAALQAALARQGPKQPDIVLKIETRRGFANLPAMLLQAMRAPHCGVMIARGDLAVECGFERMAEVQEEILWLSEAAHVPVIWATQVLETLAKRGQPSRAEVSDAALADRAECVMLNKGPYILRAVRTLDDILARMQAHHIKKRAMLRALDVAHPPAAAPLAAGTAADA